VGVIEMGRGMGEGQALTKTSLQLSCELEFETLGLEITSLVQNRNID